jgi:hypothetical protein
MKDVGLEEIGREVERAETLIQECFDINNVSLPAGITAMSNFIVCAAVANGGEAILLKTTEMMMGLYKMLQKSEQK